MTRFKITALNRPVETFVWPSEPFSPEMLAQSQVYQKQREALRQQFEREWVPPPGYSPEHDLEEMENIDSAAFTVWEERRTGRTVAASTPVWVDAIDGRSVDWGELMKGYTAVVDWPGASFWPELSSANPDALVLLSIRDPDKWYTSCSNTIFSGIRMMVEQGDEWMAAMTRLFGERFSDQIEDRDAMIAAYEKHNDAVRAGVPKERLLEWTVADGWGPICERLGVPVPSEPFPVTNTTEEFQAMMASRGAEGEPAAAS